MAEIILLKDRRAGASTPAGKPAAGMARILLFTGVRYERMGPDRPSEKTPATRKGRPRRAAKP